MWKISDYCFDFHYLIITEGRVVMPEHAKSLQGFHLDYITVDNIKMKSVVVNRISVG